MFEKEKYLDDPLCCAKDIDVITSKYKHTSLYIPAPMTLGSHQLGNMYSVVSNGQGYVRKVCLHLIRNKVLSQEPCLSTCVCLYVRQSLIFQQLVTSDCLMKWNKYEVENLLTPLL